MPQQFTILTIFLVIAIILFIGFAIFAVQGRKGPDDYHEIHDVGYKIRRYWFICLVVVLVGVLGATLPHLPYPMINKPAAGTKVTTVNVKGIQFGWMIQDVPIKAGEHILFRVTSEDVNHDFMVEDPKGNIIAQVQAMPQVTNNLYIVFPKPGTYTIRCGELCGLYHTDMLNTIEVS